MTRRRLGVIFAAGFALFVVAQLPLAAVVGWSGAAQAGLGFSRVEGTVWNGRLVEASWGPYRLGDLQVALRPLDLLLLRLRLDWSLDGRDIEGRGVLTRGLFEGPAARDTRVRADLARFPTLVPVTGEMVAEIERFSLEGRSCRTAEATVETRAVIHYTDRNSWQVPPLSGRTVCTDGVLELPLEGAADGNAVDIRTRIDPGLNYDLGVQVRTADQALVQAMSFMGFEAQDGGYRLQQNGNLLQQAVAGGGAGK